MQIAHSFMTLYVSALSMSHEVLGATSIHIVLQYSDINENLPFEVLFDLWQTIAAMMTDRGCFPFSQKIQKFRLKIKWNSNFPENPFENCGLPPEVVLFLCSEWNVGKFLTICTISQFQSLINGKQ